MSLRRWACRARPPTSGGGDGWPKASRARGSVESAASVPASDAGSDRAAHRAVAASDASSGRRGSRAIVGVPASTVHRVLCRHGLNRLAWMDRPTGQVIRRIHTDRPGELVHVDVKKLGRIPPVAAGGCHGRANVVRPPQDPRRLRLRPLRDRRAQPPRLQRDPRRTNKGPTCAGFWERPNDFFADHGITVERSSPTTPELPRQGLHRCARRHRAPPHPTTPTPDQRQGRTVQPHPARRVGLRPRSTPRTRQRTDALDRWLHLYNHHRGHTALGAPPIHRQPRGQHI